MQLRSIVLPLAFALLGMGVAYEAVTGEVPAFETSTTASGKTEPSKEPVKEQKKDVTMLPDKGALTCQTWARNTCTIKVLVKSPKELKQSFEAWLRGRTGRFFKSEVSLATEKQGGAGSGIYAASLEITLREPDWSRDLPIEGTISAPEPGASWEREVKLGPPRPSPNAMGLVLYPLYGGLFAVGVAAIALIFKGLIFRRMGVGNWTASESWSSNLTVAAGLVNGFLSLAALSETIYCDKVTYQTLTLLFATFIGLAPLVYNALRRQSDPPEGYVLTFLVAGFLTLWGTFGQLGIFLMLLFELERAAVLSPSTVWVPVILGSVIAVLILFYGILGLYKTAKAKSVAAPAKGARREAVEAPGGWSLL